jgi:c-di-GMP phosphodiesterase
MNHTKHDDPLALMTLLYVSDNPTAPHEFLNVFRGLSNKVIHTHLSDDTIKILEQGQPNIIVFDMDHLNSNHIKLSRHLKEKQPNICILFISEFMECDLLREAINIGISCYMSKPVDTNLLIKTLQREAERMLKLKTAHEAEHLVEEYLKAFDSSVIFSKTNPKGIITYANDAFIKISGYTKEELLGKSHNIVRHPDMPKSTFQNLWHTIRDAHIWKGIITNQRKDKSAYTVESTIIPILNSDGSIREYIAIRFDLSDRSNYNADVQDAIRYNEKMALSRSYELMQQIYIDHTTKLPNAMALRRDIQGYTKGTVFLLDVNNFNIFNKLHGYTYGDKLLALIASDLSSMMSEKEILYKMSADQFVILSNHDERHYIDHLANLIFAFFDNSELIIDTIENQVSFSMGIANIIKDRDAIIDAEFALDVSKRHGKRIKVIYNEKSEAFEQERESIEWLNRTRNFIYKDQIVPFYQPIVDVKTRKLYKYEALARVVDEGELIQPDKFLNAVDRLGLTTSMTKAIINKTFEHFSGTNTMFSINITERDIMDGYLIDFIKAKVKRYRINPNNVTFEVLENLTLSQEGDMVTKTIGLIKNYGCHIAIDDFGSENSNFGRLLSLQSDYLKIDGLFIRGCDQDENKQKIISAIVELSKRLDIMTIAEYVESESIFQTIKKLGVNYAQGYLFGKPEALPQKI